MTTESEFQAFTAKAIANMGRLDQIVNGSATTTVTTDSGPVKSIAKLEADLYQETVNGLAGASVSTILGLSTALNAKADSAFSHSTSYPSGTIQSRLKNCVYATDNPFNGDVIAAVNYVQNNGGGIVLCPPRIYDFNSSTGGIVLGNASDAAHPNNTLAPVAIVGIAPVSGVGYGSPSNCAIFRSSYAGATISVRATLGWALRNIAFTFTGSSASAKAIELYEAQSGNAENITVLNCPGSVAIDLETWGVNNLTYNHFRNIFVFMDTSPSNAIGVKLDGPGSGGNVAFNTFEGVHIQPGVSSHVGWHLGFCDTNLFIRCDVNPGAGGATAVKLAYGGGGGFPNYNTFIGGDPYDNRIVATGTPSFPGAMANSWKAYALGNNAPVPTTSGFVIDKIRLSGPTTFYVNGSTGSASSFGIYSGNPCLTIQQAYDQIATYFDLNGYTATISVANGTYASGLAATKRVEGASGPSSIVIVGGGGGTIINPTSNPCFWAGTGAGFTIQSVNMTVSSTSSLVIADGGSINVGAGAIFGGSPVSHKQAINGGTITDVGAHYINGNANNAHYDARSGGRIIANTQTLFLLNSVSIPQFSYARGGYVSSSGMTFSLGSYSVTGSRYKSEYNGFIDTSGAGASYFPGTSAGTTATGGVYA